MNRKLRYPGSRKRQVINNLIKDVRTDPHKVLAGLSKQDFSFSIKKVEGDKIFIDDKEMSISEYNEYKKKNDVIEFTLDIY